MQTLFPDILLKDLAAYWIEYQLHQKQQLYPLDASDLTNKIWIIDHYIIPFIGSIRIRKLNKDDIYHFKEHLKTLNIVDGYIRNIMFLLKRILDHAVSNNLIQSNPVEKTIPEYSEKSIPVFSQNQIRSILNVLPNIRKAEVLGLVLYSGLKGYDALNLKYKNINMADNIIVLERRTIGLSEKALQYIRASYKSTYGSDEDFINPEYLENYIFPGIHGPLTNRELAYVYLQLKKLTGIPDINLTILRYQFGITALRTGANARTVQYLMGYTDLSSVYKLLAAANLQL